MHEIDVIRDHNPVCTMGFFYYDFNKPMNEMNDAYIRPNNGRVGYARTTNGNILKTL